VKRQHEFENGKRGALKERQGGQLTKEQA